MRKAGRSVLFVQGTEAGGYPPIIHASSLMALAGAEVLILNAPVTGHDLAFPTVPGIHVRSIGPRPSHVMRGIDYLQYVLAAARLALTFRPDVIYASDPLGAGPGLLAARLAHAALVYHEHDTPALGKLRPPIAQFRRAAARQARFVVFPNEARARIAQAELGFRDEQLRIVWNVPRRAELPDLPCSQKSGITVYYHGSITPERIPESVVDAVAQTGCGARLRIMGYEAPGAPGYVARLLGLGNRSGESVVEYLGQVPTRGSLFAEAARADVGLALMPQRTSDLNLMHMMGASNKVFDYMGSGLAVLVTDLPEWIGGFVKPGYGRSCDPADPTSIASQLEWFAANPTERRTMGAKGRAKIESDWNYERAFASLLEQLVC
jgi:glycosyltransferase involved in cell wall biosynthesis